jgi:transcription initiation factor TFIIIB Brf1 subunit/transcription initiation factor TFIIB
MRGTKTDAIICAVLFLASKEEGVPRTFKEIAKETGITDTSIKKLYKVLIKQLPPTGKRSSTVHPSDLVNRYCSKLELLPSIVALAQEIARKAAPKLEGKSPSSIATASILLATESTDHKRHEREIANAASIAQTTVRNVYKEMVLYKDELLPPSLST